MHEPEVEVLPPSQGDDLFSAEDNRVLSQNRALRRRLIGLLTETSSGSVVIPEDKADKALLVNLLNATDSEIMGRARLKVAAKTEEAMTNMTGVVAEALRQCKIERPVATGERLISLPRHITIDDIVPGEMEIGVINVTLEELRNGE